MIKRLTESETQELFLAAQAVADGGTTATSRRIARNNLSSAVSGIIERWKREELGSETWPELRLSDSEIRAACIEILRSGRSFVEAVRYYWQFNKDRGLKQAKEYIDGIRSELERG